MRLGPVIGPGAGRNHPRNARDSRLGQHRDPGGEQLREGLGDHGPAEVVSLRFITFVVPQKRELFPGLHPLRYHPEAETLGHPDHRGHDAGVAVGRGDLTDEGLVDLEGIDRKLAEIAQAGIAGAEVVDRDLDPLLT